MEGAAGEQAGKRERGDELAHQPVGHSLWGQGSLEAYNELLFGSHHLTPSITLASNLRIE